MLQQKTRTPIHAPTREVEAQLESSGRFHLQEIPAAVASEEPVAVFPGSITTIWITLTLFVVLANGTIQYCLIHSTPLASILHQESLSSRSAMCGAPRTVGDEDVERVVVKTLESLPRDATHWSTRSMAKECGLSAATVSRIWRAFCLKPHRFETFKLSRDPLFIEKVRDIVGLYLHPPERAVVLCVDEKSSEPRTATWSRGAGSRAYVVPVAQDASGAPVACGPGLESTWPLVK